MEIIDRIHHQPYGAQSVTVCEVTADSGMIISKTIPNGKIELALENRRPPYNTVT